MKNYKYIAGKGILVGKFSGEQLKNKEDKELFKKVSKETGYKYANTEIKKDKMLVYACSLEDCRDFA